MLRRVGHLCKGAPRRVGHLCPAIFIGIIKMNERFIIQITNLDFMHPQKSNGYKTLPYVYKVDVTGVVFVPNFALGKGLVLFLYRGRVQIENC